MDLFGKIFGGKRTEIVVFEDSVLHVIKRDSLGNLEVGGMVSCRSGRELADSFMETFPEEKKLRIVRYTTLEQTERDMLSKNYGLLVVVSMRERNVGAFRDRLRERGYDVEHTQV